MKDHRSQRFAVVAAGALLVGAGLACSPGKGVPSAGDTATTTSGPDSTSSGSASSTASGTGTPTTTTDTSPGPTGPVGSTTTTAGTTTADSTSAGSTSGEPAGPCSAVQCVEDVCDFEACACAMLPEGLDFVDCGYVRADRPTGPWQAAQHCVLAAAGAKQAFKLVFDKPVFDSKVGGAFVGFDDGGYRLHAMHYDTWGQHVAATTPCETIAAVPGCTVAPLSICLECVEAGAEVVLCDYNR